MNTQDLIPKVVEAMKTSRQVRPTIYMELDTGGIQAYPLFNFIGDARTKAHFLFATGREAGLNYAARELLETCFITEIWLTQGERNPTPGHRPPAHIPSMEGVMFAIAKNTAPYETLVKAYQIKRKGGKPTELTYLNENTDPEGLMGVAFIAGWKSRTMTDQEVAARQPQGMRAFLG
jgi:hypothetical protein